MLQDPIIAEIRRIRHEIEVACQNDAQAYYEYIQRVQQQYLGRVIRRAPRPTLKMAKAREEKSQVTNTFVEEREPVLVG